MSVEELLSLDEEQSEQTQDSGESYDESSPPEESVEPSQPAEEDDEYASIEDAQELKRLLRDKAKSEKGILAAKADEVRKRQQLAQQIANYQGQLAQVKEIISLARQQQGQPQQPQNQALQQKLDALDIPIEFDEDGNPKAKLSIQQLQGILQEQLKPIAQTHQRIQQQAEMQRRQQQAQQAFQKFLAENPERAESLKVYESAKTFVDSRIEKEIELSGYPREQVIEAFRRQPDKFHEFLSRSGIEKEFGHKYRFPIENVLEYAGVKVAPMNRLDAMLRVARGNQSSTAQQQENRQFIKKMQGKPNNLLGAGGGKVGSKSKYDLANDIGVHDLIGLPREQLNRIKKVLAGPD